jgi:hypothetical protein
VGPIKSQCLLKVKEGDRKRLIVRCDIGKYPNGCSCLCSIELRGHNMESNIHMPLAYNKFYVFFPPQEKQTNKMGQVS